MTQEHISFGSIEQYRNTVKQVRERAEYHGVTVPTLCFHGTVKLHGTNASVVADLTDGTMYAQSRSNVITPEDDNAGFARFAQEEAEAFYTLVKQVQAMYPFVTMGQPISRPFTKIVFFGEWCGGSIQKGVALNKLPKMFVLFGVRLWAADDNTEGQCWLDPIELSLLESGSARIKNIEHFKTFNVDVDFGKPEIAQNIFVDLTMEVERECPVSKHLGVEGVGEGIVWTCLGFATGSPINQFKFDDLCFKTKGEKHSDTKTKTIVPVDAERMESIRALSDAVLTDHRLEKMIDKLREQGLDPTDIKNTGGFLKLVGQDVEREEEDTITASGFSKKDVMPVVNRQARQWFMDKLKTF